MDEFGSAGKPKIDINRANDNISFTLESDSAKPLNHSSANFNIITGVQYFSNKTTARASHNFFKERSNSVEIISRKLQDDTE